jgi:hypothetical protein
MSHYSYLNPYRHDGFDIDVEEMVELYIYILTIPNKAWWVEFS